MKKFLLIMLILLCGCNKFCSFFDETLLDAHNRERSKRGVATLEVDEKLTAIAQTHAEWMTKRQKLQHQSLDKIMKNWNTGGENIAYGQENIEKVMNAWMHSQGHKKNILNKNFTHVGFGQATTKNGTIYWCADFGG